MSLEFLRTTLPFRLLLKTVGIHQTIPTRLLNGTRRDRPNEQRMYPSYRP